MRNTPAASESARSSGVETLATFGLVVLVAAVGGFGWWLASRPELRVDPEPLARLPHGVERWTSEDLGLDSMVEGVLRADFNLQRAYFREGVERPVWVYIGYYGTRRGGRPEHTPRGCYTGAGWDIAAARTLESPDGSGRRLNEYLVTRGDDERRLVHFWYRSHHRTGMVGGFDQHLDQALGRLRSGRADGALVRVSTVLEPGGEEGARRRLLAFGDLLDRQLADHWPVERPDA